MNHTKIPSISIIDDDHVYQLIARRTIEESGMTDSILQFYDGEEAFRFFKENILLMNLPELILLDINMPYMDGWAFLDEFSRITFPNGYKPLIHIFSTSASREDINRSGRYSILSGYHFKPITTNVLKDIVRDSLHNQDRCFPHI